MSRGAPPGLAVRARRVKGAPVVAVRVWLRGGARAEPSPGAAYLAGRALVEGSARRDWRRIADEADGIGMEVSGFATLEGHGVALDGLAADWRTALEWAAELALEPSFPAERSAWLVRQAQAELDSMADQPASATGRAFLHQLYHPHPAGRPLQGTPDALGGLGAESCRELHAAALRRGVLVVVTGEVDEEAVERRVRELFPDGGSASPGPEPPAPAGRGAARQRVANRGAEQCHLFAGHLTVARDHPDYPALRLLGVVLGAGAGLSGRIPARVREAEGLAYSAQVQTAAGAGHDPGHLVVYVGTSPATLARAEAAVVGELERLLAGGLEDGEVADARAYVVGREPFRRETARQWAGILAQAELLGLPYDRPEWVLGRYHRLGRGDLEAAARRHLRPAELRVTVGEPAPRRSGSAPPGPAGAAAPPAGAGRLSRTAR